jgi:hypothetical protein
VERFSILFQNVDSIQVGTEVRLIGYGLIYGKIRVNGSCFTTEATETQ